MSLSSPHPVSADGYRLRAPAHDADAVTALKIAVETAWHGESDVTVDVRARGVGAAAPRPRARLVGHRGRAAALVGYGLCWVEAPPAEIVAEQLVHPGHRGHGLSALLLDLCETRAAAFVREAGPGATASWACGPRE